MPEHRADGFGWNDVAIFPLDFFLKNLGMKAVRAPILPESEVGCGGRQLDTGSGLLARYTSVAQSAHSRPRQCSQSSCFPEYLLLDPGSSEELPQHHFSAVMKFIFARQTFTRCDRNAGVLRNS